MVAEEAKKYSNGKVPLDKMTDIVYHVFRKARAESQRPSQDSQ